MIGGLVDQPHKRPIFFSECFNINGIEIYLEYFPKIICNLAFSIAIPDWLIFVDHFLLFYMLYPLCVL